MHVTLNHHSGEPFYRQIVEAVRLRIVKGDLAAGDQLPSLRELAEQLKINMRTVVKAYEELDRMGLVVMQQGKGVFVAVQKLVVPVRERRRKLQELAVKLLIEAAQLGSSVDEVIDIIHHAAAELETK